MSSHQKGIPEGDPYNGRIPRKMGRESWWILSFDHIHLLFSRLPKRYAETG